MKFTKPFFLIKYQLFSQIVLFLLFPPSKQVHYSTEIYRALIFVRRPKDKGERTTEAWTRGGDWCLTSLSGEESVHMCRGAGGLGPGKVRAELPRMIELGRRPGLGGGLLRALLKAVVLDLRRENRIRIQ